MNIAVISAHYMPEVGYQEVHLAKAFARSGNNVKVFTSTASVNLGGSLGKQDYKEGLFLDDKYKFAILRLPSLYYKSKAFSFQLKKEVRNFKPDLLVLLGVAKGFPYPLLNDEFYATTKIVSLYGDAEEYLERKSFSDKLKAIKHDIGYKLVKEPLYTKAVKYCHKIILNIPESDSYFKSFLNEENLKIYETKKLLLYLGFDPDEYFFDENSRKKLRAGLGIKEDEVCIITSTRIIKRKNLESMIQLVDKMNSRGKKVKYIMVGFLGDDYENELKQFIAKQQFPESFICFPFLNAARIRGLYCAADAGIWLKVAISIQEAMGTGLPVILENKSSMNHLIKDKYNGWFFNKTNFSDIVEEAVMELSLQKKDRSKLSAENASRLSYDSIAKKIAESVK